MSEILAWLLTVLIVVVILSFAVYVVGLRSLPTSRRPRTRKYDRLGALTGSGENPDYRENPGEDKADGPDLRPGKPA